MTALVLPFAVHAADPIKLINENFESPKWSVDTRLSSTATPVNGWIGNSGVSWGSAATIFQVIISNSDNHTAGGTQSLYLRDAVNTNTPYATYSLEQTVSAGNLDFWLKQDTNYSDVSYCVVFLSSSGTTNFDLYINNTNITIRNSAGTGIQGISQASANYTVSEWNNINISFDKGTNSLEVRLGGEVLFSLTAQLISQHNIKLEAAQIKLIAGFQTGVNSAAYFDDIVFENAAYAVPEPTTWALWGGLGALALVVWHRRSSA